MQRLLNGKQRVVVGMSGGVDSTLAASLLHREGHEVTGVTMQIWDGSIAMPDSGRSGCFGPGEAMDIEAAAAASGRIGIPHHVIPLADTYRREVLDYFRSEYRAGRTPNPCVMCNRAVKFGALLKAVSAMGVTFDKFATGHYARVEFDTTTGRHLLKRGIDRDKDQSYFLSRLAQETLCRVAFPLGLLTKKEVREQARECGFTDYAEKPESQDFIESDCYGVLFDETDRHPGPIEDTSGRVLGQHRGIVHYTIGQRKGLGLSGFKESLYVVRIDAARNAVIVGPQEALMSRKFVARDMNWIAAVVPTAGPGSIETTTRLGLGPRPTSGPESPTGRARPQAEPSLTPVTANVTVKIRQQHHDAPATISFPNPQDPSRVQVEFVEPQMSITPGQTAVFYNGDTVLGGGTIE